MNRWSPDFPGRLVDFPDYCRLVERAQERRRGTVFAYEPLWTDGEGRIKPSNRLVIAAWTERRGSGAFEVLANARLVRGRIEGLRNYAQLHTDHHAADIIADHIVKSGIEEQRQFDQERRDRRQARLDLGRHVLKRAPDSRIGHRMVRESQ